MIAEHWPKWPIKFVVAQITAFDTRVSEVAVGPGSMGTRPLFRIDMYTEHMHHMLAGTPFLYVYVHTYIYIYICIRMNVYINK